MPSQRPADLDDVLRSSTVVVEDLLREGDVQERVWAAWALGMREPARGGRVLEITLAHEMDAGVRRHLLVVLAGVGRNACIAQAASRDADADVRATATRLLARLAEPEDAGAYDLICARTIDIAWQVRCAVADAVRADILAIPGPQQRPHQRAVVRRLVGMAFDPDPEVRAIVRARIEAGELPSARTKDILTVLDRLREAPSPKHTDVPNVRALVRKRPPLRLV
jgi:hypothetical protein